METDRFITSAVLCIRKFISTSNQTTEKAAHTFTSICSDIDIVHVAHQWFLGRLPPVCIKMISSFHLFVPSFYHITLIYCRFRKFVIEESAFSRFREYFRRRTWGRRWISRRQRVPCGSWKIRKLFLQPEAVGNYFW